MHKSYRMEKSKFLLGAVSKYLKINNNYKKIVKLKKKVYYDQFANRSKVMSVHFL